jgi:hypothetical protein
VEWMSWWLLYHSNANYGRKDKRESLTWLKNCLLMKLLRFITVLTRAGCAPVDHSNLRRMSENQRRGSRPIKFTSLKHNFIGVHKHSIYYSLLDSFTLPDVCDVSCSMLHSFLRNYNGLMLLIFLVLPHSFKVAYLLGAQKYRPM